MTKKSIGLDDRLYNYLLEVSFRDHPLLKSLRDETEKLPMARMQIAPEQGQFMYMLVKLIRARQILEIGTFTGYSSLCMAMALPDDGRITTCDVSAEYTDTAIKYWQEANVEHKIELRLAPAIETLQQMIDSGNTGSFDLMFIDAEKTEYEDYYSLGLQLLRSGGLIIVDNVLWNGSVADASDQDPDTVAIRAFNENRSKDDRVELCMLPVADGLTLAIKK